MYRYSVDNAVTYTPEDVVLFRDSPFASWMERLTLENPDHGIPPDIDSSAPHNTIERQDDIVDTLRVEGRGVELIDWDLDERGRRADTLAAMRGGADFIVNGLLALGPLSGSANLLMRTSGYSELGDFLYIPCDTQAKTTLQSAFRLCFLADLLHSLQGQLPPQMLIIRGGADVMPLQTEDHIYYYRAVKQRFMAEMSNFRKHRMPDPAESAQFGRWSECANEVLKQRALAQEHQQNQDSSENLEQPLLQVAAAAGPEVFHYDMDNDPIPTSLPGDGQRSNQPPVAPVMALAGEAGVSRTLAEQASLLPPDSFRGAKGPGPTPNLARYARLRPVVAVPDNLSAPEQGRNRRSSDVALENLEFIGSSGHRSPLIDLDEALEPEDVFTEIEAPADDLPPTLETGGSDSLEPALASIEPPDVSLGEPYVPVPPAALDTAKPAETGGIDALRSLSEASAPAVYAVDCVPESVLNGDAGSTPSKPHPLDTEGFNVYAGSVMDMDMDMDEAAPPLRRDSESTSPPPDSDIAQQGSYEIPVGEPDLLDKDEVVAHARPFSNSLITSELYEE